MKFCKTEDKRLDLVEDAVLTAHASGAAQEMGSAALLLGDRLVGLVGGLSPDAVAWLHTTAVPASSGEGHLFGPCLIALLSVPIFLARRRRRSEMEKSAEQVRRHMEQMREAIESAAKDQSEQSAKNLLATVHGFYGLQGDLFTMWDQLMPLLNANQAALKRIEAALPGGLSKESFLKDLSFQTDLLRGPLEGINDQLTAHDAKLDHLLRVVEDLREKQVVAQTSLSAERQLVIARGKLARAKRQLAADADKYRAIVGAFEFKLEDETRRRNAAELQLRTICERLGRHLALSARELADTEELSHALALLGSGKVDSARSVLQDLNRGVESANIRVLIALGEVEVVAGNWEAALVTLRNITETAPNAPSARLALASALRAAADAEESETRIGALLAEATAAVDKAIQLLETRPPHNRRLLLSAVEELADLYEHQYRFELAVPLRVRCLSISHAGPPEEYSEDRWYRLSRLVSSSLRGSMFVEGTAWAEELTRVANAVFGRKHLNTLLSKHQLAFAYSNMARMEDALRLQTEVLHGRMELQGPYHPDTLQCLVTHGGILCELRRYEEGLDTLERTIGNCRALLGKAHSTTIGCLEGLAMCCWGTRQYARAVGLCEEALELRKGNLGRDALATLDAMGNLASLYARLGKLDEALSIDQEVLDRKSAMLGPSNPSTNQAANNLATTLLALGRATEAQPLLKQVAEESEQRLGRTHPGTLAALHNLAGALYFGGDFERGEELLNEVFELRKEYLGSANPSTINSMSSIATLRAIRGEVKEGEQLQSVAFGLAKATGGENDPDTISISLNLAVHYMQQERYADAIAILDPALKALEDTLGCDHPHTLLCAVNLGCANWGQGDRKLGRELLVSALTRCQTVLGDGNWLTKGLCGTVAVIEDDPSDV
jgi:tetratricopeptide (TPR) repeat protein